MEVYDDDGTPALPFAVPPPVPEQYELPPHLMNSMNELLRRTYDELGIQANMVLDRLYDERKLKVSPSEAAITRGMIACIDRVCGKVKKFILKIELKGSVAFEMPADLKKATDYIRPSNTA